MNSFLDFLAPQKQSQKASQQSVLSDLSNLVLSAIQGVQNSQQSQQGASKSVQKSSYKYQEEDTTK